MTKTKGIFICIFSFIILSLSCVNVWAASEVRSVLENQSSELVGGEEVVVALKIDNYEILANGINVYKATLEYDKDIFEEVSESNFQTQENWGKLKFNKDTGEFIIIKKASDTETGEIAKITLKVKENVQAGKANISIKDINTSGGKEDIKVEESEVIVDIIEQQPEIPEEPNKPENPDEPEEPSIPENPYKPEDSNKSENKPQGKQDKVESDSSKNENFTKTGDTTNWTLWFVIIGIEAVIVIVCYKKGKFKKLNYKNKKVIMILIIGAISLQTVGTVTAATSNLLSKGELNGDGEINYEDVELLEKYLIHLEDLSEEAIVNADINSDGNITVTDLSLLIKKLEKTLDYKVVLSNARDYNYYPKKNEEITLKFIGDVSYDEAIKEVIINNEHYKVKKAEESMLYTVDVDSHNTAGIKEYHFTEVLLSNGKRVKVDYIMKLDVLKDIPSIENYTVNEDINESRVDISFNLKDEDKSIQSAGVKILNDNNEIIKESELSAGENTINIDVENDKKYIVNFSISYDLDSNKLIEHEVDNSGVIYDTKELEFIVDYNWQVSNIATYNNGVQTNEFEKQTPIEIRFNSSNSTRFEPAFAVVNGKEYRVTKEEDQQYVLTVDGMENAGKAEINLEEILLANGKRFSIEEDKKLIPITILKEKPSIEEINLNEDSEKNKLAANFNLVDNDSALESASIILLDENNNEISRKEVKTGENEVYLDTKLSNKYIVKVLGTYTLADEHEAREEVLIEKQIDAKLYAEITKMTSNIDFVEKGQIVTLQFAINSNKIEDVARIRVNNLECIATKLSKDNYEVKYTASNDSGVQNLNVTKIIYADGKAADVNKDINIEVLKDKPSITEFSQKDNLNEGKVTLEFNVLDEDQSFIDGKAILKNKEDNSTMEKKIIVGENNLEFSVEEDKPYVLEIYATYDRDSNTLPGHKEDENKVVDELLTTEEIELVGDYRLEVGNVTSYKENNRTKYFNKNEEINIRFSVTNSTMFNPEKAVINGKEYNLKTVEGFYEANILGFDEAGKKEIIVEKVILSNTKELPVSKNNQVNIEVLKDKPTISGFSYLESGDNKLNATFNVEDRENAIGAGEVIVYNENQDEVLRKNIVSGINQIEFNRDSSEYFEVKVIVSYDLDNNVFESGQNEYSNETMLQEGISLLGNRKIEMKDILDITLYEMKTDYSGNVQYREVTDVTYIYIKYYPERYIARIQMKDMPDFYSKVNDYRIEDNKCYLQLDYDKNLVQYTNNGQQQNRAEVLFGEVDGSSAISNSFSSLISRMKADPTGDFVLTRDYDASEFESNGVPLLGYNFEFRGTLNGNGHTISNLKAPLFDIIKDATIENLKFENVISANAPIAKIAYSGTNINNVHVNNLSVTTKFAGGRYGGIVAVAQGGTKPVTISNSSVTNFKIVEGGLAESAASEVGGIAGLIQNAIVEDCYVEGTVRGDNKVGGIAGEVNYTQDSSDTSIIRNCITKVNVGSRGGSAGGVLGYASKSATLTNNVSLSTGYNGSRIYGGGNVTLNGKNIAISESELKENSDRNIQTISKNDFSKDTLKSLGFNKDKWNMDDCSYDNLPSLNNSDPRNESNNELKSNGNYIPDYEILKQRKDYNSNKEMLYSNLYKLMPFYDSKYLVIDGKKISEDHVLNEKPINSVVAFDSNRNVITYLTEENYDSIHSIRIIFKDRTTLNYNVTYKYKDTDEPRKTYGRVAMYNIDELGIEYNYDSYIVKQDAAIVDELVNYVKDLEYDKDLKHLVDLHSYDKRGYAVFKEYFNNVIRTEENARKFVLNLLANAEGYSVTQENPVLNYTIRNKTINGNELARTMFAYTYFSRFYGVEMGGTSVSDLMLFKGGIYGKNVTFNNVVRDFWNSEYKSAHVVDLQYRDNLGVLLGTSQGDMIEKAITAATDYEDPNDWFTDYFSGRNLLTESAPKDYADKADYRAWTQIKKQPKYIMNILTLPEDTGFLVSSPGTFVVGSQMVYINEFANREQQEKLLVNMKEFGDKMANFYNNLLGTVDVSYLNKYADIQIDNINVNKYGTQSNGKCTDPFHINFNDLLNEWFLASGAAAYATDGKVNYASSALATYAHNWTHEIGHNQSYKLFFKGNGFRPIGGNNNGNLGTEDYTDGHTTQSFGDGDVNWNLSYNYNPDALIATNLTQDRVNTVDKLNSYYKGMYEAIDLLDYLEAEAFLKLTPEEQSKVAVQVQYPEPNDHTTVRWKELSSDDFERMNLRTVEDLWDNQITIRPGISGESVQHPGGAYGSEGMHVRRWYQPYNDNGRTHSWGFTYTTWQMLGIAGYEDGYLNWFTGKSRTDLDAIRKITKDDTMTWKKFKTQRYELMKNSADTNSYIDAEKLVEDYVKALKADAVNKDRSVTASTNIRRINYHHLKRATNDFRKEVLDSRNDVIHISTIEEFREKLMQNTIGNTSGSTKYYVGNYVLDNDIDLSQVVPNENETIIDGYFMGKLDGNGHKLIGNTVPIFNRIKFANISNLTIENSNIAVAAQSNEKNGALAKVLEYSTVHSVIGKNITVSANKETGALVGNMTGAVVNDTHVVDGRISGTARVGAIAGYADKSQIMQSSSNVEITATSSAVGGFIGEITNTSIVKDSYSKGKAKGNVDVGGFIGYVNNSCIINSFSNAKAEGNSGVASFVGQTTNNSVIKNNLTLVNQFMGYKFDGRTPNDKFVNFSGNYESEGNVGTSTRERTAVNFDGKIDIAAEAKVKTERFYTETLGWNNEIWDFSNVSTGGLPKLKNSDVNDNLSAEDIHYIETADEFITKITENPYGKFVLNNDIDLSSKNSLINVEFRGILDGNNHKIIGNIVSIFNNINKAIISNLVIENSVIKNSADNVGVLSKTMYNSTIENVHVTGAAINGANKIGGLAGYAESSKIKQSSSNVSISATGSNVGGLIGQIIKSTIIENSYSSGKVTGNENVGGLVGNVTSSTIKYSYSSSSVNGTNGVAGFVGQSAGNSNIENNIALGNQMKQYKFDGRTEKEQLANYRNNYEYEENRGKSTLLRDGIDFQGKIAVANKNQIINKDFYKNTLGWNEEIWDLSNVTKEFSPKLKNLDPNESKGIGVHKAEISSIEQFINELANNPTGEFTITADLDFADKQYNVGSVVVPGTFEGVIKGNDHTIRNLKNATIFEQFNGEVDRLNFDKFDYGATYYTGSFSQFVMPGRSDKTQSNIAVFAKNSLNATYTNMKFSRITMFGKDNVAVVTSVDNNSTFENINISKVYLNVGDNQLQGNKASMFISEKTGGSIRNCYVHGEVFTEGKDGGAVLGVSHGNVTIENVISNVYFVVRSKRNIEFNGLFAGKIDATTRIRNSASIGTTTTSSKQMSKFVGTIADINSIENCYENASSIGTSSANGNNIIAVEKEELKSKEFYINKLRFNEDVWALNNIVERHYTESVHAHGSGQETDFPLMIFFGLK